MNSVLTHEEIATIMKAAGEPGDAKMAVAWAMETRVRQQFLDLVLEDKAVIKVLRNGEMLFIAKRRQV